MICQKCGNECLEGSNFCRKCGADLKSQINLTENSMRHKEKGNMQIHNTLPKNEKQNMAYMKATKSRAIIILTILLVISLIGNAILLAKLNNNGNQDIIKSSNNVPNELIGTWEAAGGRVVEIFEDGKVYWTYNASGAIYTGYIGSINGYSIVLSKMYEGYGNGHYQSMSEVSEAELQDISSIYDITMHGDAAFSAQNVDPREYAWSFIKVNK